VFLKQQIWYVFVNQAFDVLKIETRIILKAEKNNIPLQRLFKIISV